MDGERITAHEIGPPGRRTISKCNCRRSEITIRPDRGGPTRKKRRPFRARTTTKLARKARSSKSRRRVFVSLLFVVCLPIWNSTGVSESMSARVLYPAVAILLGWFRRFVVPSFTGVGFASVQLPCHLRMIAKTQRDVWPSTLLVPCWLLSTVIATGWPRVLLPYYWLSR